MSEQKINEKHHNDRQTNTQHDSSYRHTNNVIISYFDQSIGTTQDGERDGPEPRLPLPAGPRAVHAHHRGASLPLYICVSVYVCVSAFVFVCVYVCVCLCVCMCVCM